MDLYSEAVRAGMTVVGEEVYPPGHNRTTLNPPEHSSITVPSLDKQPSKAIFCTQI